MTAVVGSICFCSDMLYLRHTWRVHVDVCVCMCVCAQTCIYLCTKMHKCQLFPFFLLLQERKEEIFSSVLFWCVLLAICVIRWWCHLSVSDLCIFVFINLISIFFSSPLNINVFFLSVLNWICRCMKCISFQNVSVTAVGSSYVLVWFHICWNPLSSILTLTFLLSHQKSNRELSAGRKSPFWFDSQKRNTITYRWLNKDSV